MDVKLEQIVLFLAAGLFAGFLTGWLTKGKGFGFAGNLFIGCLGAVVGGLVFPLIGIHARGLVGQTILATLTAVALLFALNKLDIGGGKRGR
ncbi:MAG: GlsB/YeaQ/YmgE family stress response membrane protein [Planctomycetota bacterium]|nr:GlsB/YeaQ/YmgE family stress response membrane protein [Planctomycetota bacterium]